MKTAFSYRFRLQKTAFFYEITALKTAFSYRFWLFKTAFSYEITAIKLRFPISPKNIPHNNAIELLRKYLWKK